MPAAEVVELGQSLTAIARDEDMGALRRYRLTRRGGGEEEHSVFFTKYDGEWTVHQVWW